MFLSLVFHNHQPVGQLPWAFDGAWQDAYAPFLETLERHPKIRVALHFSGPLLDWLEDHHPETIAQVKRLSARGQVEILGGGEAEPILAIWPFEDQIEQLRRLQEKTERLLGVRPRGAWLAERVWESCLAASLQSANLEWTFVDESVFRAAGIAPDAQHTMFNARGGTATVGVFPINETLRRLIPWGPVEETIGYLRHLHGQNPEACALFADDGEKFGAWPGTTDYIFGEGWLDRFFGALEASGDWLETVLPGECARRFAPEEVDLPDGSYAEMQEWSGGNWRFFLERYEEARDLFDEITRVRRLVLDAPSPLRELAYAHVLRAQCNDALWHGVFGGLYLRHLRQAIYAECSRAQSIVDGDAPFVRASDEPDPAFIENETQKIAARSSGQIFGWTTKTAHHNFVSTLRRRRESYHDADAIVDWHARGMLVDHFFGEATTPEIFARAAFEENGDFASEPWELESACGSGVATLLLRRDGNVWHEGKHVPLRIEKTVRLRAGSGDAEIGYQITNTGDASLRLWWGNEWNIAMSGAASPERHYHANNHTTKLDLNKIACFDAVTNPIVADTWAKMWFEWNFEDAPALWHIPIETVSQMEGGAIEKTHQSSAFVFGRRIQLAPGASQIFNWTTTVSTK